MFLLPDPAFAPETRVLRARELWTVATREPLLVECRRGTLWVTAGGEDVVLEGDQSRVFSSPHPVVVEALSDAELTLRAARSRSPLKR
ncbi:MAG TPA: hypothetical protein VM686_12455 [Polyangiaceae bacterium]|jgi:hypothetical protein|nr:hypothetical protein [Polyangiaceae bacterium]